MEKILKNGKDSCFLEAGGITSFTSDSIFLKQSCRRKGTLINLINLNMKINLITLKK